MNLRGHLERRLAAALREATGRADPDGTSPDGAGPPALVSPASRPEFGDYQANGVMAAAKRLKTNPRKLAEQVAAAADLDDLAETPTVAGPGFINIRLSSDWIARRLTALLHDDRLGADAPDRPQTVVVDYSAPNLAKEMHVGHLRSTIIGDALARTLEFLGHKIIRQNHVGDWGRQFGVVVLGMWHLAMAEKPDQEGYVDRDYERLSQLPPDADAQTRYEALKPIVDRQDRDIVEDEDGANRFEPYVRRIRNTRELQLAELEKAYRFTSLVEKVADGTGHIVKVTPFEENREVPLAELSRYITAAFLQDPEPSRNKQEFMAWTYARGLTVEACYGQAGLYGRLGVSLSREHIRGESFYGGVRVDKQGHPHYDEQRNRLPQVVADLKAQGLVSDPDGPQCVFLDEFKGTGGEPLPLIVQKSDGAYLYATTDLAAIRYRVGELGAERVLYVVDARQGLHFRMVFAVARKAGFAPPAVHLEHVAFGMMLGADGRPFRTREGGTVKLTDLLDEAERRAVELVRQKNPDLPAERQADIARVVGIGAVKYADLAQNRASDYVFSFDKMLALDGNTAPYMQYAYARIRSIFRKAGIDAGGIAGAEIALPHPGGAQSRKGAPGDPERALGLKLLQFPETVKAVADDCLPNVLCAYLYDLATAFTGFYERCPVLKSPEPTRRSRLALCELTARTIRKGLELLGIETVEQM